MSPSVFYSFSLLLLTEVGGTDTQDSDKDGDHRLPQRRKTMCV